MVVVVEEDVDTEAAARTRAHKRSTSLTTHGATRRNRNVKTGINATKNKIPSRRHRLVQHYKIPRRDWRPALRI